MDSFTLGGGVWVCPRTFYFSRLFEPYGVIPVIRSYTYNVMGKGKEVRGDLLRAIINP